VRTGVLAKKLGMTRVYSESRVHNSVTVLRMPDSVVLGHRVESKDGYNALILGFEGAKVKNLKKPQKQFYAKAKKEPMKKIKEFRVTEDNFVNQGAVLAASHFVVGQFVDVKSKSIGKGFAGAMKRHNFAGLRASHGVSVSHRSHGSTGNSQDPGRVWKGKKMAGQLGDKKITVQSLEIVSIDEERGLILVKGGVPGSVGSWVEINDAKKKSLPVNTPYPAGIKGEDDSVKANLEEKNGLTVKNNSKELDSSSESKKTEIKDKTE
jgi:large subunit ribosomal protein L3